MENQEEYLTDTSGETSALLVPQKSELAYVNPVDIPDLEQAEVGFSLEAKYLKFEHENETIRVIFNGFTQIRKNEGGEIKPMTAAVLQNKDGLYLNATSNILDQLTRVPVGTAVQITFTGTEKTASGYNVKKFDIRVLNVKVNSNVIAGVANASVPAQTFPAKQEKVSSVDRFWAEVYKRGLTNVDGQDLLKENSNNFDKAYEALFGPY